MFTARQNSQLPFLIILRVIFCATIIFTTISCAEKKPKKELVNPLGGPAKGLSNADTNKNVSIAGTNNNVIIAKFSKDSVATTINGLLGEAPHNVVIYIDIKQGKSLSAFLLTKNPANIRINQIFTPDGKADGPFGKEINKPILKKGMYKLVIGHDLMAEGGSAVNFQLRVIVK